MCVDMVFVFFTSSKKMSVQQVDAYTSLLDQQKALTDTLKKVRSDIKKTSASLMNAMNDAELEEIVSSDGRKIRINLEQKVAVVDE